jgi:hypothetical protein
MATKKTAAGNTAEKAKVDNTSADNRDEQIRLLNEQLEEMRKQMSALQKMQAQTANTATRYPVDEAPVTIVSRFFSDTALESPDHTLNLILKCAVPTVVDYDDMKEFLKETAYHHYKKLFEEDLLYFTDEADYKRFNIKRKTDLSEAALKKILFLPIEQMLEKMNELTGNKRNYNMIHVLIYRIAEMLVEPSKPLKGWDYENRVALEKYFSIIFDQIIQMTGMYDIINDMHLYN